MIIETISEIVLTGNNELLLKISGQGRSRYQYVYREAAGVYWDEEQKGFKSAKIRDWSISEWYIHILSTINSGLGISLILAKNVNWVNIPEADIVKIQDSL